MKGHYRPILGYLNRYKVSRVEITQGGKHPQLRFEHQGIRHMLVLASTPGDQRWLANMKADIRRQLGPPPPLEAPDIPMKRSLDDMTLDLKPLGETPQQEITGTGLISLRAGNGTLVFYPPGKVVDPFVKGGSGVRCLVEFRSPDTWVLTHGGERGPLLRAYGREGGYILEAGGRTYLPIFGGGEGFLKREASFTLDPLGREIRAKLVTPLPVNMSGFNEQPSHRRHRSREAPETKPVGGFVLGPAGPVTPLEDDMRAVLGLAREIEARSPYRMTRIKRDEGEMLVWRAPLID